MIPNAGRGLPRRARVVAGLTPHAGVVTGGNDRCVDAIGETDGLPVIPSADRTRVRPIGRRLSGSPSDLHLVFALFLILIPITGFAHGVEARAEALGTRLFMFRRFASPPSGEGWGGVFCTCKGQIPVQTVRFRRLVQIVWFSDAPW